MARTIHDIAADCVEERLLLRHLPRATSQHDPVLDRLARLMAEGLRRPGFLRALVEHEIRAGINDRDCTLWMACELERLGVDTGFDRVLQ